MWVPTERHKERTIVITRRLAVFVAAVLAASTMTLVASSSNAGAATYSMRVVSPIEGRIGIDGIYAPDDGNGYDMLTCSYTQPELGWDKAGNLTRPAEIPSRKAGPLVNVRFEMYPGACAQYDAWA